MNTAIPQSLSCQRCELRAGCKRVVLGWGSIPAKIIIIGEAPGSEEDTHGFPFIGPAGKLLRDTLSSYSISPDLVYITNAVKCRPKNNTTPRPAHISACKVWLDIELRETNPDLIVALGETATKVLWGMGALSVYRYEKGVGKRGQPLYRAPKLGELRPRDELKYNGIPVIVGYHPSAALQQVRFRAGFLRDIEKVAEFIGVREKRDGNSDRRYTEVLGMDERIEEYRGRDVAIDTEYDQSGNIIWYSYSKVSGEGYVVNRRDNKASRELLDKLIRIARRIKVHSAQADVPPICRFLGINIDDFPYEKIDDTAILGYLLGDKPLSLKSLAENRLGRKVVRLEEILADGDYNLDRVDRNLMINYSGQDADLTISLDQVLQKDINQKSNIKNKENPND